MTYAAPLADIRFSLRELADLPGVAALPGYENATEDMVDAVLEEAGKLSANVLAPLNRVGDKQGAKLENGVVRTPEGFAAAYRQFVDGGWNALPFDPEYGGQGMPWLLATAVQEMWQSANMGFGLVLLLNQGAIDAIHHHGSAEQKAVYLPKMISGEWTGTMNLTEPQAGSDLGQLRSKAVREGGHYRVSGQKIFITYGEHDMAENIVHLVLARTPDAPAGVRGISLFIVPKFLPKADGTPGERNDLRCISLEHKLGIHASPTAVMSFGENGGAVGYLVGEEGRGLSYMFTMMNNARLAVGVQGLSVAERAYQQAVAYARSRVQSKDDTRSDPKSVSIIHHADIRRMLMTMRSQIEAMRALAYHTAAGIDGALRHPDAATRRKAQDRVDLLIPVVKAWSTDLGNEIASLGVQIHGGMGFIEETGA
ncbi:MAG: acyl-CoA dehydrogenase, partial [Rhodospirillales bacterium]|nr:acyl-CoA dehydrogenase [Rhodospirillales bacterium]